VIPAILTEDPEALEAMLRQVETFTTYAQIDIMDGRFVPSRSITWQHLSDLSIKLSWEAHLMVLHPEDQIKGFQQAGARKIVFHYEATPSPREVISTVRNLGLEVGLAVNPGFYGSKFIPEALDKLGEFRDAQPGMEIGIDGGIKESNVTQIARSGADVIFVGSAIFLQPQPAESFRHLLSLAKEGSQQQGQ
jgi:ribulose-phosphate 3-epimerase